MSDSDDTDILLLIPPNYFLMTVEEKLRRQKEYHCHPHLCLAHPEEKKLMDIEADIDLLLNEPLFGGSSFCGQAHNLSHKDAKKALTMDAIDLPPPPPPPPPHTFQYLSPQKTRQFNEIDYQLNMMENTTQQCPAFSAPSDLSSISTCTVRTQFGGNHPRRSLGLLHSTPKGSTRTDCSPVGAGGDVINEGLMREIDNYLESHNDCQFHLNLNDMETASGVPTEMTQSHTKGQSLHQKQNHKQKQAQTHPQVHAHAQTHAQSHPHAFTHTHGQTQEPENLISLSEIWGKSGHVTALPNTNKSTIVEEQLRRQHLEKTIHSLQSRLLEYQQRLSVAIEVDRTKDAVIASSQQECNNLNAEVQQVRDALQRAELQQQGLNEKMESLQRELAQAVSLAAKFQDKNEHLEAELTVQSKRNNECDQVYKEKLEELEIQVHAHKRSEEYANGELSKMKDRYAKIEYQHDKLRVRCEELERERDSLRQQKDTLQEYHQKQKNRAEHLETQKKALQASLSSLADNELALKKKLEMQQKQLKAQYQQQLEQVVAQKLKEFQMQLDKTEEALKAESRERERCLAERAVKQLEMINEKNDLEMQLLQEKHSEEVELYRIQLANASKKIDQLEAKLNCYKTKRADIAEKLHNVMETQWQKALEILTSPSQAKEHTMAGESNNCSPVNDELATYDRHHCADTPKSTKTRKTAKENDLNAPQEQHGPVDRLQAYIELLLSKSPSDFDKLDEILALTKSRMAHGNRADKSQKRHSHNIKPPWKG